MTYKSPWCKLIHGQFGCWINPKAGSRHLSDYTRWIGCRTRVGIELEFPNYLAQVMRGVGHPVKNSEQALAVLNTAYQEILEKLEGERYVPTHPIKLSHDSEIQVLWEVRNPIRFRNCVFAFGQALHKCGLTMMGGVHLNIQIPERNPKEFRSTNYHIHDGRGDVYRGETDKCDVRRVEDKYGPSALSCEELLAKLFIAISLFPRSENRDRAFELVSLFERELYLPIMFGSFRAYLAGLLTHHGMRRNFRL